MYLYVNKVIIMAQPQGTIKQDINFLDEPLWFQNLRHDGKGFTWNDKDQYIYRSDTHPPDKVDSIILLYLMLKSQQNDFATTVETTRYEILNNCGFPTTDMKYYKRVEESLMRWNSVDIYFAKFYDRKHRHQIGFHILDHYEIDDKNNLVTVGFNSHWIKKIENSQYFKYIRFDYYKALKRPVTTRLYEILCHKFLSRENWSIRLTRLGEKIGLTGRTKRTKKGTKHVIYASDVLVAIKPAINEINKLASDIELAKNAGIPAKELFTITYEIRGKKQDRVIIFYCHPVIIEEPKATKERETIIDDLEGILLLLKKRTGKLEKVVKDYAKEHGTEYVKWNILYSNKTAKKNYSSYLQKALAENWAEEWAIEEKQRIEQEDKRQQEYEIKQQKKRQEEEQQKIAERQKPLFKEALAKIKPEIKSKLWDQAYKEVPEENMTRPMLLKIRFAELVLEYLNDNGEAFIKKVINDFALVGSFELPE